MATLFVFRNRKPLFKRNEDISLCLRDEIRTIFGANLARWPGVSPIRHFERGEGPGPGGTRLSIILCTQRTFPALKPVAYSFPIPTYCYPSFRETLAMNEVKVQSFEVKQTACATFLPSRIVLREACMLRSRLHGNSTLGIRKGKRK